MRILVTGAAGFIGFHLSRRLVEIGSDVIGLDNLCDYYDVSLKTARLDQLCGKSNFTFVRGDIANRGNVDAVFDEFRPMRVVNLAAQVGVRYSLVNPFAYAESNIIGFLNVLEASRRCEVDHLVYASSSSVYGANSKTPYSVEDRVDHPVSFYAATKKTNELMAYTYSHLYNLPTTGLRFFTVYGPWGRPDMAPFLFAKAIIEKRPIDVFNHGNMSRDFTYVDDVVEGIVRVINRPPQVEDSYPSLTIHRPPYRIYNLGNNKPVPLMRFIECIEHSLGLTAEKRFLPHQRGDVVETFADIEDLARDFDFRPSTPIEEGVQRFIEWFVNYHQLDQ